MLWLPRNQAPVPKIIHHENVKQIMIADRDVSLLTSTCCAPEKFELLRTAPQLALLTSPSFLSKNSHIEGVVEPVTRSFGTFLIGGNNPQSKVVLVVVTLGSGKIEKRLHSPIHEQRQS
jgi:hypothetical protein